MEGAEDDVAQNTLRQRNFRIRERVLNGLLDMYVLSHYLSPDDRKQVFEPSDGNADDAPAMGALFETIAFVFLGLRDVIGEMDDPVEWYEEAVEQATRAVFKKYGIDNVEIEVSITTDKSLRKGQLPVELKGRSERRLRQLLDEGEITNEEFAEAIMDRYNRADQSDTE